MPTRKTPKPKRSFVPGPALADRASLLAWLKSNPGSVLRLPVVIHRAPLGGYDVAFIGTEAGPSAEDAIVLDLDDSTLGIGLSDRLRFQCAEEKICVVWIEGSWGSALPDLEPKDPPPWPFTVHDAGPPVEGSPRTILIAD